MQRLIVWDFDGTLAYRPGLWSGCLIETLDEHAPGHGIAIDEVRPHMRDGFPWDTPEVAHPELCEPAAWWREVEALMAAAYVKVGIGADRARELARHARARYIDVAHGWTVFPDTAPVLTELAATGWRHAILSNHVPELPAIVDGLGLTSFFEVVSSSAATGFEKPNPAAFELMLEHCGHPGEVWMVGDNPRADVAGAEAAGIPAVLVRTEHGGVARRAADLYEAAAIIAASELRP